ncbi:MAG: hypothetical protein QXT86_11310 [Archaeoglobaceae archaeon]
MGRFVGFRLNDEEAKKVLRFGLKSNKDIKNFILAKVDEDIKQAAIVGLLREVINELNETKKLFSELIVKLDDVTEVLESLKSSLSGQASSDSEQATGRVIHVVYEMLKLFILNYTQLYQSNVKQKVLEEMKRLRDEV